MVRMLILNSRIYPGLYAIGFEGQAESSPELGEQRFSFRPDRCNPGAFTQSA